MGKSPQAKRNKLYKKKIYALCKKASKKDALALAELESELKKSTLARWAVKHWKKVNKYATATKQIEKPLSEDAQARKDRVQQRGFEEGAMVPGSNIRKVSK